MNVQLKFNYSKSVSVSIVSLNQDKKVSRCYTLTVAWVILLCILFLAALRVLWITFSNMTTENNQLQISNNNLINQRDQQQISNNNLIKQKDQLQINNNNLIKQKDQLEKENDGLKLTLIGEQILFSQYH